MQNTKTYSCLICKTKPDQISHHKSHLETQKHKDKRELLEVKLSKLSLENLIKQYNTDDIEAIVDDQETRIYDRDGEE